MLGNGSGVNQFSQNSVLPNTIPTGTNNGSVMNSMRSTSVGGKRRRRKTSRKSRKCRKKSMKHFLNLGKLW
jgi:hypothetical protein|uniref:Uncharacterized protein n=1 Tax=viral metagenome TaxID=1070528 RepID=A0A6C0AS51_9ZZZZ